MIVPPTSFLTLPTDEKPIPVPLPAADGAPATKYVMERMPALAINAALATGRALLVRGEPGLGKSLLARAAAELLNRDLHTHVVDARTEPRDLLYTIDAVSRLASAQLAGARGLRRDRAKRELELSRFIHPGPLWWAFDPASAVAQAERVGLDVGTARTEPRGTVLLIDEIDKADPSVPNSLLDAFGAQRFSVEGMPTIHAQGVRPLVIVTTNEERALPDAFVRRCLVLSLELPKLPEARARFLAVLIERGSANLPECHEDVLKAAANLIADERESQQGQGTCLPGVAEYIDLLRAVTTLAQGDVTQRLLLSEVRALATRKHPAERNG